jgi:colanic acid/amylovoran biosynthesis glycosyltransferase
MNAPPRRLAYVLKRYPRISETFIVSELLELQRQGETVTVFAISRPEEPFAHGFLSQLTAPVVYLPHRPLREPVRVLKALATAWRTEPREWLRAARWAIRPPLLTAWRRLLQATVLREELRRRGVDHAHAHFASAAGDLVYLARRMGGPSYSVTAHAKDIYHEEVKIAQLRDKLSAAAFIATVSEPNRRYLRTLVPDRVPVALVPNSVDVRRLGHPNGDARIAGTIVSVARLVEKKGLVYLVEACAILARRGVPVRLDIVGDGPLRAQLERASDTSGAPVRFWGELPQECVLDMYGRAAAFCLPCVVASTGDRDGLPTSVLEAMAVGVPVVTTAVNGLVDAVDNERTGLIVPERDPLALADALERLLATPELAARLATEARREVERHYSAEGSAALLRSMFPERA